MFLQYYQYFEAIIYPIIMMTIWSPEATIKARVNTEMKKKRKKVKKKSLDLKDETEFL